MHDTSTTWAAAAAILVMLGCGQGAPEAEEPAAEPADSSGAEQSPAPEGPAEAQTSAPSTAAHMQQSFASAIGARDALIQGKLEEAKRLSKELSEQDFSALPGDWKRRVGEMQKHAGEAAIAMDPGEAALSIARVAAACGSCHSQRGTDSGQILGAPKPTAGAEQVKQRMARHEMAADELWVGLVAPSTEAWKQGAITLRDLSPEPTLAGDQPVNEDFTAKLNEIKALGLKALSVSTVEDQVQLYADYLSRCAGCHTLVGR